LSVFSFFTVVNTFISLFFQAEDGIRYRNVTGVQTCALPIFANAMDPNGVQPGVNDRIFKVATSSRIMLACIAKVFPNPRNDCERVHAPDSTVKPLSRHHTKRPGCPITLDSRE